MPVELLRNIYIMVENLSNVLAQPLLKQGILCSPYNIWSSYCCSQLMDWMEANVAELTHGHHALRLNLISKVNGIKAAEEYFWNLPDVFKSVKTYSALLNCYAEHSIEDKGLELYEKMKAMNFGPSTLVYNNLMSLYKSGQPEEIPVIYKEMYERGVSPNDFTYSMLIESYNTMNDVESAEKFLEELEKVTRVHWSLYTYMASSYVKLGHFDKVEVSLKKAEGVMDKGDIFPRQYLISIYACAGKSSEVKRIWESLKPGFNKCSNKSYEVMLSALRRLDDFDSLQLIFQEWQSSNQRYDIRIANIMITAYLDKVMIDEAESIRQSAVDQGRCNDKMYKMFALFYLTKSKVKEALAILRERENMAGTRKWVPTKEFLNRFPKHFQEAKDVDGMESFCECLKELGCLDGEAYEALMRTYISAGRTNPSVAQRVEDDGIYVEPEMAKLIKIVCGS
jgi:pentatricopeptide repeat protein